MMPRVVGRAQHDEKHRKLLASLKKIEPIRIAGQAALQPGANESNRSAKTAKAILAIRSYRLKGSRPEAGRWRRSRPGG
jgi:hypothetical protein